MSCTICNSERKCNFLEPHQICSCQAIHSLCWVEKLKDKEFCPVCESAFTILDNIEVYGEDLDFTYCYCYYDGNFYLKNIYDPDGNLYCDEFYENGKISQCIYYYPGDTEIPEREHFFNDEILLKDKYYYSNGTLKEEVYYYNNTLTTKISSYRENGTLKKIEEFSKDFSNTKVYNDKEILIKEDIKDYKEKIQKQILYELPFLTKGAIYTIQKPM
jgi:antitoxin component YwqK of YwqJK toxin-antitoxin module